MALLYILKYVQANRRTLAGSRFLIDPSLKIIDYCVVGTLLGVNDTDQVQMPSGSGEVKNLG